MRPHNKWARFLGGLTLGEGLLTACGAAWSMLYSANWAGAARAEGAGVWPVAYASVALMLFLGLALAASGWLLWRGEVEGLDGLALALACEFEALGLPTGSLSFGLRTGLVTAAQGARTAAGCMTFQTMTAYPLIALALMYPAYNYFVPSGLLRGGVSAGPEPAEGARRALRALASLALVEVVAGLVRAGPVLRAVQHSAGDPWFLGYAHVEAAAYAAMAVNAAFEIALLCSAVLLWRRARGALLAMGGTILAEAGYFVLSSICTVLSRAPHELVNRGLARSLALADFSLQVQFLTAFPVLAVALILLADRRSRAASPAASPALAAPRGNAMSAPDKTRAASRLRLVLRVLAALTILETAAALWELGVMWSWSASFYAARGGMRPPLVEGFWLDAALALALIVSAVLLWRGRSAGLSLLTFTIIAEGAAQQRFPVLLTALTPSFMARPRPSPISPSWGSGNLFLGIQFITLFPIFAAVLIILAARYRAILASDGEGRAPDGRPALASWKAMVAIRLLAAVTFLEAASGLLSLDGPLLLLRSPLSRMPPLLAATLVPLRSHGARMGYTILGVDVAFSVLLIACAVLLWLQKRWGLIGLTAVLLAEVGGLVGLALVHIPLESYSLVTPGLSMQIGTGYPFVSPLLLILAGLWRRAARARPA